MSIRSKVMREIEKKPQRLRDLKDKLGNDKKVQRVVDELLQKKKIVEKQGVLMPAKKMQGAKTVQAKLVKLGKNFAFAKQAEGGDIFVPGRGLCGALPGDEVMIALYPQPRVPGSLEGEILVVTNPRKEFVGTVIENNGRFSLVPDDAPHVELLIKKSADGGVQNGEKAAVQLLRRGVDYHEHRAGVTVRFGSSDSAKQCVRALLYSAGMVRRFPEKVKTEARQWGELTQADLEKRTDLRNQAIFTIDSAETKDIDDAISLQETATGYQLGVHIADVSHYVRPGSELDKEAFNRGTSVYYADSVIPMLPKHLSNNLCSLNPKVDRLAFSCIMQLDADGNLQSYRFEKSVINSRVKGVYKELNAILAGNSTPQLDEKYAEVAAQLPLMQALYEKRVALRNKRGNIALETDEAKLILNDDGVCVDIQKRHRGVTECMIEEFMLLANQSAASLAREKQLPFVYRVHEKPPEEKATRLKEMLVACGMETNFAEGVPTQTELAALLDKTRSTPLERTVHTAVLRSMAKAVYTPQPKGHFGLALEDYAHFTSPIRRYPDLAIHRILSDVCDGVSGKELKRRYEQFVLNASEQSTDREIAATQLERNATARYKAEYMKNHLGESFAGVVSGITMQGLYVELPNTVEGLIHTETLCKDEPELIDGMRYRDPLTGTEWTLGQTVQVKALRADVAMGRVDFALAE